MAGRDIRRRSSSFKNLEVVCGEMVPRRNIVARHTPRRVNAERQYFDMEIIIRPYVEDIRGSIEQLRTLFATGGLDDEGHGWYTYGVVAFVPASSVRQAESQMMAGILVFRGREKAEKSRKKSSWNSADFDRFNGVLIINEHEVLKGNDIRIIKEYRMLSEKSKEGKYMSIFEEHRVLSKKSKEGNIFEEDGVPFEIELEGFHSWLGQMKGNAAATPGPGDGLMVLPRQCTGAPPMWRHIRMVEEVRGSWIIAVVRSDNMYCKGIINMDWLCHELRETNPDPARRLPPEYNATDAGCFVSYHSIIGCRFEDVRQKLMDEGLGFYSAARSVQILSCYPARLNSGEHPGMALASLIFSIFEAARMNLRYSGLDAGNDGRCWIIGKKLTSELWDLSQNWRNMSYPVLDCRDTGYLIWTPNKYLDKIGRGTLELTVEALSIVLNSPEWYYRIVGQRPTRMQLVLDAEKKKRRRPDGDGTFFALRPHTAVTHVVTSKRRKDWFHKKRRTN